MNKSSLKIFGNVLDILEGRVTQRILHSVDSAKFRFALGGSSLCDEHGVGETLIIEGLPHISWVQAGKLCNASQSRAFTPFLMGIDQNQPIEGLQRVSSKVSLEDFYGELSKNYPMGVAVAGSFRMEELRGVYLKKPPIYHENINEHHASYWSCEQASPQAVVFLFGVVIPPLAKKTFPKEVLEKGFYCNPKEKKVLNFDSHTHAAFVDSLVRTENLAQFLEGLKKLKVSSVRHVLTNSIIQEGNFILFPLGEISLD